MPMHQDPLLVESVFSGYCSAEQGVIAMSSSVYFNQTSPVVRSADYTAKIVATFKTKLAPFHYIAFSGITRFHCIAAKKYLPDPAVMTSIQAQSWALQHACIHISHAGGMPGSLVINGGPPLTRVWLLPKLNRDWNGYHWHHKIRRNISMMTSSNGNIFALLAICAGNSPEAGEFPAQRPVARSFDVFFDLCLNKRLRKQSWGWWFETLSRPLWRHCNARFKLHTAKVKSQTVVRK